jgi:hypothetical protein
MDGKRGSIGIPIEKAVISEACRQYHPSLVNQSGGIGNHPAQVTAQVVGIDGLLRYSNH